jgi:hypothetical protein
MITDLVVEARRGTSGTTYRPTSWRATACTPLEGPGASVKAAVRHLVSVTLDGLRGRADSSFCRSSRQTAPFV